MEDSTKVITATELKTNLGKYLDYVIENSEVVVTKNGKKAVRLTPYITEIERYFAVKEKAHDYVYGGKKVSYEEFMEIYEKSELRMEYINGEIVLLASPGTRTFREICMFNFAPTWKGKSARCSMPPLMSIFTKKI